MRAAAAVLALAAAGLLAGCTPTSTKPEVSMLSTVEAFMADCSDGPPHRVMDSLVSPARDQFIEAPGVVEGCAAILGVPASRLATLRRTDFADYRARVASYGGGDGTVAVTLGDTPLPPLRLRYGLGLWQIQGRSH